MQAGQKKYTGSDTRTISGASTFDASLVEVGDTITISGKRYSSSPEASVYASVNFGFDNNAVWLDNATNTDVNAVASYGQNVGDGQGNSAWTLILYAAPVTFTVGTAETFTASTTWSYSEHLYGSQTVGSVTFSLTVTIEYDGNIPCKRFFAQQSNYRFPSVPCCYITIIRTGAYWRLSSSSTS